MTVIFERVTYVGASCYLELHLYVEGHTGLFVNTHAPLKLKLPSSCWGDGALRAIALPPYLSQVINTSALIESTWQVHWLCTPVMDLLWLVT